VGSIVPPRTLAVVGATATGKTALAEALAERLDAEIVCADSRQVFRELEIGTGKPTPSERAARPHHLFEALALGERASAGWYGRAASAARKAILDAGRTPLLVGGSGLYLRAAERGLASEPPHDPERRARLRAELEAVGPEALHARLSALDPETAARVAPRDRQRITRALEVAEGSGRPLSWWRGRHQADPAPSRWLFLEIAVETGALRERIAERTRGMFDHGLVEETHALLDGARGDALRSLRAVGYDEAIALIEGRLDRAAAEARTNLRTAQLAKRQRTWFRHQVDAVRLDGALDTSSLLERALAAAREEDGHARRQPRALR
jgi:tRNA dimethylallyltransferase